MPGHQAAVSLKKSHDIVILSFCKIVKGQAKYLELVRKTNFIEFHLQFFFRSTYGVVIALQLTF